MGGGANEHVSLFLRELCFRIIQGEKGKAIYEYHCIGELSNTKILVNFF